MADGKGAEGHSAAPPPPSSVFAGAAPVYPTLGAPMAGPSTAAAGDMGAPPSYEQSEHMTKGPMKQQGVPQQPPYPGGAGVPDPQQQPAVIVQYVQMPSFGVHPVNLTCPHCQAHVRTTTESEPGPLAWILAGVLCVIGLPFCACIPCCIDSFNTVTHKCPQCKAFIGRYKGGM